MSRSRTILVLLSMAALACSPDRATAPKDPLATRLTEVADSLAASDYRVASALHAAAAMVEAGGKVSSVQMVVDSVPRTFSAVALRMSYSQAACDQLKNMFMMLVSDSSAVHFDVYYDPCQPVQSVIAWEGEDMSRIVVVQGDTGTSAMNTDSFDGWNFWGELYDRKARTEWWLRSGSQSTGLVGDAGACRATSIPNQGIDFTCRLVTLRHRFDLVLEEYPVVEFEYDSLTLTRRTSRADTRSDSTFGDSGIYVDSSWVWEPGPSHTLAMSSHVVNGLSMEITKFDFTEGMGRGMMASAIQGARYRRSRTR